MISQVYRIEWLARSGFVRTYVVSYVAERYVSLRQRFKHFQKNHAFLLHLDNDAGYCMDHVNPEPWTPTMV